MQNIEKTLYVGRKERFAYYFSALFRDMVYALISGYLTYFYIDIMGLSGVALSAILIATKIFDGIDDPLLGVYFDKRKFKTDKAKPFFKYLGLPGMILITFMFFSPQFSGDEATNTVFKVVYAILTYCLFEMILTINGTAYMSLYNSISPNADERSRIISTSRLFSTAGSSAIYASIPVILSFFPNSDVKAKTWIYFGAAVVVAVCFLLYNVIMTTCVKERVHAPHDENVSTGDMFKSFFKNKILMLMMISNTIAGLINAGTTSLYFYTYNLGNPALSTIVGFAAAPGAVIGALIVPKLVKVIDKNKLMIITNFLAVALHLGYLLVGYEPIWILYVYTFLVNFPLGIKGVLYWNMISDTVDYAEWKTGMRNDGMVYSIEGFLSKVVGAVGSVSTAIIISVIKFVPNAETQSEFTMRGLFYVPLIISILSLALSTIPYFFYKFSRKEQFMAIEELAKRHENKGKSNTELQSKGGEVLSGEIEYEDLHKLWKSKL